MNDQEDINILPEDRIHLTNDQKNLITLALEKQLPPEDAKFLESEQKRSPKSTDSYTKINDYYVAKYGQDFGKVYLAAITGGEKECKEGIDTIERAKDKERLRKENEWPK